MLLAWIASLLAMAFSAFAYQLGNSAGKKKMATEPSPPSFVSANTNKADNSKSNSKKTQLHFPAFDNVFSQLNHVRDSTLDFSLPAPLGLIASYRLDADIVLTIAFGSVLRFACPTGAIVTSANEMFTGSTGIDRAILKYGGEALRQDRDALSLITNKNNELVKCPTGKARLIGPKVYHELGVPYVIHAVGPNFNSYHRDSDSTAKAYKLLENSYKNALSLTLNKNIGKVAIPLISSGVFRGTETLTNTLSTAVLSIRNWAAEPGVQAAERHARDIVLCAYSHDEACELVRVCDAMMPGSYKIQKPK